jgi:hypothetical protein
MTESEWDERNRQFVEALSEISTKLADEHLEILQGLIKVLRLDIDAHKNSDII